MGTVARVKSSATTSPTSSQWRGKETRASGGGGAEGIGGGDRLVLGILVVVEEHAVALLLPPFRGRLFRGGGFDVAGEGESGSTHFRVGPTTLDPDVHVDPAAARCLGPADETDGVERLARDESDGADLRPGDARHGVEVDPQLVGVIEVVGADRVRVEIDTAEVRHPGETGVVGAGDLRGRPA